MEVSKNIVTMEMGEDAWEHHVGPFLMNCGQEDNNVGEGHGEYFHHADEVSDYHNLN